VRDDRALEFRALRKLVDVRRDAMEDEPQEIRVAIAALADERELALEPHDVGLRLEEVGELGIEKPGRADREARRRFGEVAREEGLGLRE
jgi:hypothetical protein